MKISMMARAVAMSAALAALLAAAPAHAAETAAPVNQSAPKKETRMGTCSKEATGKKGDERKAFMKQCLSTGKAEGGTAAVSDKAKACKAEAKGMRGNARKDFLKECESRAA